MLLQVAAVLSLLFLAAVWILTYRRRNEGLAILSGAAAGLLDVQLGGVHAFTILVLAWAAFSVRVTPRRSAWPAAVFVGSSAVLASSVMYGPLVNSQRLALQLLALTASAAVVYLRSDETAKRLMLIGFLGTSSVASATALLQVAGIVPSELFHLHVSSLGRPAGIYSEPDWLGLMAAAGLIVAWRLPATATARYTLVPLNALAMIFAFARAAWLGLAVSVMAVVIARMLNGRRQRRERSNAPLLVLAVTTLAIPLTLLPDFRADLGTRLQRTVSISDDDVSGQARLQQIRGLQTLAERSPWHGQGLSAAGRVGVSGRIEYGQSRNNVASNWILGMWVDGHLLALPLIIALLFIAARSADSIEGQSLVLVLVNSLASNVTMTPVTWFLVGLSALRATEPRAGYAPGPGHGDSSRPNGARLTSPRTFSRSRSSTS